MIRSPGRLPAASADGSARSDLPQERGGDHQGAVPRVCIAAGDGQIELFGKRKQSLVELHGQFACSLTRQGHGQHGGQRLRAETIAAKSR